jgi:iron-sulfur cluster repair protein YtfE (RIC family)
MQSLREKRAWIRARLDHVDALAQSLAGGTETDGPPAIMARVVTVLEDEVLPYLEWEGRMLHPVIDKFACEGPTAFSASMQHEHAVVDRWIGELAAGSRDARADARAFARRVDRLLGLLAAHFEVEDQVFLPVLDRAFQGRGALAPRTPFE